METAANRTLVIEAGKGSARYWQDLWHFRDLIYTMAWRDIIVRYKQAVLGVAWGIIRPLATTLITVFTFKVVLNFDPGSTIPYVLLVYSGTLIWSLFAGSLDAAANSLVAQSSIVSKVYFPRMVVPISRATVNFVDFLISLAMYVLLAAFFAAKGSSVYPNWHIVFLPLVLLLTFTCAMGFGLILGSANVKYRDVGYIIPFLLQIGYYASPIFWTSSKAHNSTHLIFGVKPVDIMALNPMFSLIEAFRWCLLSDAEAPHAFPLIVGTITTAIMLAIGIKYFRFTERMMADHI